MANNTKKQVANEVKLEQKQITKEINKVINNGFKINTDNDKEFFNESNFNWDDLNKLKEDLGANIISFVKQVNTIILNKDIINNLGDKLDHFNKVVSLFFSDIEDFSHKVKAIRVQHEHLSGHIDNINDFNKYNRIAIEYHALFSELATLITPTLSDLMFTITEALQNNKSLLSTEQEEIINGPN